MSLDSTVPDYALPKAPRWQCAKCGHGKGQMHTLKTWPEHFRQIINGTKQYELRKNDRNFECGDTLLLREWDPETEQYSGREIYKYVAGILHKFPGLEEGYVIMSLIPQ